MFCLSDDPRLDEHGSDDLLCLPHHSYNDKRFEFDQTGFNDWFVNDASTEAIPVNWGPYHGPSDFDVLGSSPRVERENEACPAKAEDVPVALATDEHQDRDVSNDLQGQNGEDTMGGILFSTSDLRYTQVEIPIV